MSTPADSSAALGSGVYNHLSQLLLKILQEKPSDPLKAFESISWSIKQQQSTQLSTSAQTPTQPPATPLVQDEKIKAELTKYLESTQHLLKKPKKYDEDGNEEEEDEIEQNPSAPDLEQQAHLLKEAGVALRPFELHRLAISVQTLCNTNETLLQPRFWGKIYGTTKDYYIIESKVEDAFEDDEEEEPVDDKPDPEEGEEEEEEDEEPPASRTEPWGIGANEYAYYASNSVDGPWTRLPKVTPAQIIAARGMRRFLTGSLAAAVFGFPRFPWGEAAYLRTQIARISASTVLAPKGAFIADEEEPLIALENEEFRGVRASELLNGDNWQHSRPKLLLEGRVEAFVDENADEEPDDDELDELQREQRALERSKKEKPVRILAAASSDRLRSRSGEPLRRPLWKFHLSHAADTGVKPPPPPPAGVDTDDLPQDQSESHVVASAHSLLWPGAVSLAQNKTIMHVYVGYGLKQLKSSYRPIGLPSFQSEYQPPTTPNKRGVVVNPIGEQSDELPPPPEKDTRTEEEKEYEAQEEAERLARVAAEEGEPIEEIEEDEDEEKLDNDEEED